MERSSTAIAAELDGARARRRRRLRRERATRSRASIDALEPRSPASTPDHAGAGVAITEPVPLYLLDAAGLENVTPDEFSEAIEEGTDVAPARCSKTLELSLDGDVRVVLVYNAQTGGPETERCSPRPRTQGSRCVAVTETLPGGPDYVAWMQANIDGDRGRRWS